jgi:hypothetical protein
MKTVFEHIDHVKGKPHHIRKRVAFAAAAGATGLIAVVWLAGSLGAGAFAIKSTSFADATGQAPIETVNSDGSSNLAGAAAAFQAAKAPAHLEVVSSASSTGPSKPIEQSTIPF